MGQHDDHGEYWQVEDLSPARVRLGVVLTPGQSMGIYFYFLHRLATCFNSVVLCLLMKHLSAVTHCQQNQWLLQMGG